MIDIHSHILPALDDGAANLSEALSMARLAADDGIKCMACTPHIVPGLYDHNDAPRIRSAMAVLQTVIVEMGIDLHLVIGADVHIAPDLPTTLGTDRMPTLNGTRYFLFEPTHHVLPPRLEDLAKRVIEAGFVPIVTHPERLSWIEHHYDTIERLNALGCLMQITAGSVTGSFGRLARRHAERMLEEGRVDIVASDAHNTAGRPPLLSRARDAVEKRLGADEAEAMVDGRPAGILSDRPITPVGMTVKPETPIIRSSRNKGLDGFLRKYRRKGEY